jgi:predicted porin
MTMRNWTGAGAVILCVFAAGADARPAPPVRVEGTVDAGLYRDLNGDAGIGSIQPSFLAFSGEDAIGATTLTFRLSARFRMQDGQLEGAGRKPFWHDEATVGLRGAYGSLRFGRALDATYSQDWQFDLWSYQDKVASPAWDLWHYNYASDPHGNQGDPEYGRLNGGVFYDSPPVNGIGLHLSTAPGRRPGDAMRPLGISLTYQDGSVALLLSSARNSDGDRDRSLGISHIRGPLSWSTLVNVSVAGRSVARALTTEIQYAPGTIVYKAGCGVLGVDRCKAESVASLGFAHPLSAATSVYVDTAFKRLPTRATRALGVGITQSF